MYVAGSLSLAMLEIMAHLDDYRVLSSLYSYIAADFPDNLLVKLEQADLPRGWDSQAPTVASMSVGDNWVNEAQSAVLGVPSVVVPGETNYLMNPAHPDFDSVRIGDHVQLQIDPRLERP